MADGTTAPAFRHRVLRRLRLPGAALLIATTLNPSAVQACAVCYGDPESELTQGAFAGVIVLGIIVYGVLMGMVGIGVTWFVRARNLRSAPDGPL